MPTIGDYLNLSNAIYTDLSDPIVAPPGWSLMTDANGLAMIDITGNGMYAAAFKNNTTGEIVISYQGTNMGLASGNSDDCSFLEDQIQDDASIAACISPQVNNDAMNFALDVYANANGSPIYLTGHSLGGEEAEYVMLYGQNIFSGGMAFGAPGVPQIGSATLNNPDSFTVWADYGDAIANFVPINGGHVGTVIPVGNPLAAGISKFFWLPGEAALIGDHLLSHYARDLGCTLFNPSTAQNSGSPDIFGFSSALGQSSLGDGANTQVYSGDVVLGNNALLDNYNNTETLLLGNTSQSIQFVDLNNTSVPATGVSYVVDAGNGNTLTASSGAEIEVQGLGSVENVSNGSVSMAPGSSATVIGNSDSIGVNGLDAPASLIYDGTGSHISMAGDDITLTTGSQATLSGGSDDIDLAGNNTLTVNTDATGDDITAYGKNTIVGDGSTTDVSGAALITEENGGNLTLKNVYNCEINQGSNDILVDNTKAVGDTLIVNGTNNSDTFNGSSGSVDTSYVYVEAGAGLTLTGQYDDVYQQGNTSLTINGTATGDWVDVYGAGTHTDKITGAPDIIADGGTLSLTGTNDTDIEFQAGRLTMPGTSTGDDITFESSHLDGIISGASAINLDGTDGVTGSNNQIYLNGNNVWDTIWGSHNTLTGGTYDSIFVQGTYDDVYTTDGIVDFYGTHIGDAAVGVGNSEEFSSGNPQDPGSGYYGFVEGAVSTASLGSDIGIIAQHDLANGDAAGAAAAETGRLQAYNSAASTGAGTSILENAKWDNNVITWSMAATPDSQGDGPNSEYESAAQKAFATWSAASGLTFQEVSDSSSSDISIGWEDFSTESSGVIGYTTYNQQNGVMSNAAIHLEDPSETALAVGSDGELTYTGTDVELSQVLLHEIGHALGLADGTDSSSVMYYALGSSNRTLDSTDIEGINTLYGPSAGTSQPSGASVNQLIQAMASFGPDSAVQTSLATSDVPTIQAPLLAVGAN